MAARPPIYDAQEHQDDRITPPSPQTSGPRQSRPPAREFPVQFMNKIRRFFEASDFITHEVLRPLSHIRGNWDLIVDQATGRYMDEEGSFAWLFNHLIDELEQAHPPARYHDSEDRLGEEVRRRLNWDIAKCNGKWINRDVRRLHPSDYLAMLEQGAFRTGGIGELVQAAAGRIHAAIDRGQLHFDDMEWSHQVILAGVLAAILYHREPQESWIRKEPPPPTGTATCLPDSRPKIKFPISKDNK